MTELDRQIVDLRGRGYSYAQMVAQLGVNKALVKRRVRLLLRQGVIGNIGPQSYKKKAIDQYIELAHRGYTWADIGNQLGMCKETVRQWRIRLTEQGRLDMSRRESARFVRQTAPRCDRCGLRLDLGQHQDPNVRVPQVDGDTCFWCRVELGSISPNRVIELLADCRQN